MVYRAEIVYARQSALWRGRTSWVTVMADDSGMPNKKLEAGRPRRAWSGAARLSPIILWMGEARTAPGVFSGWHHHGEHNDLRSRAVGSIRSSSEIVVARVWRLAPGTSSPSPAHTVHREATRRGGAGSRGGPRRYRPIVINVDGPHSD